MPREHQAAPVTAAGPATCVATSWSSGTRISPPVEADDRQRYRASTGRNALGWRVYRRARSIGPHALGPVDVRDDRPSGAGAAGPESRLVGGRWLRPKQADGERREEGLAAVLRAGGEDRRERLRDPGPCRSPRRSGRDPPPPLERTARESPGSAPTPAAKAAPGQPRRFRARPYPPAAAPRRCHRGPGRAAPARRRSSPSRLRSNLAPFQLLGF